MKKLLSLLAAAILVLAGCATTAGTEVSNACAENTSDNSIGFVTDTGGINDKSFNQGTWEGIEQYCADTGAQGRYIESADSSEYVANLQNVSADSDVVVAAGFYFEKPIYDVAMQNPDVNYVLIDAQPQDANGNYVELDNVHSYMFNEEQAGYLVGYIAGALTKTNRLGYVGGMQVPAVEKFGYGYLLGAQAANPDVTVDYQYSGTFEDITITKAITETYIAQGADIIFTAAGGANGGVLEAAKTATLANEESPVWAIGVDIDMYDDGIYTAADGTEKSVILTSAIKKVGNAAYEGAKATFDGTFAKGTSYLGLAEDAVGIPTENPNLVGQEAVVEEANKSLEAAGDIATSAEEVDSTLTIEVNGTY